MDWSNSLEQEFRKQVAEGHHRQEWRSPRQRLCGRRGFPSPQIRIVHRRQVVMDQTVGMNAFDCQCRRHRVDGVRKQLMSGQNENGPESLASGLHAVMHGFMQPRGTGLRDRQALIEALVDQSLPLLEFLGEIHDLRIYRRMSY